MTATGMRPECAPARGAAAAALAEAESLVERGAWRAAIDRLTAANRVESDPAIERRLVRLRHAAFAALGGATREVPPSLPAWPDPFPGLVGLPEISGDTLTGALLGGALLHHGSLLVRGLVSAERAALLADDIARALDAYAAAEAGRATPEQSRWFTQFEPGEGYAYSAMERAWARQVGGGMLVGDSPRGLFDVIETWLEIDLGHVLAETLGEWPALSFKKSSLRLAPPNSPTEWHQDGAFLGAATRTVNVWLACSPCGVDAPGIDVVGRRIDHLVEQGTGSAQFAWSVGCEAAERVGGREIVRPQFAPGDALLFDQMTLHRTGVSPTMTRDRYAIESWFFAPATYPHEQIPIVF